MKVTAYLCDCCGSIKIDDEIVGINPVEDMFDKQLSFPITHKLDKTNVHGCHACYREIVDIPASAISRKKNEDAWKAKVKELSYMFRQRCVLNSRRLKKPV